MSAPPAPVLVLPRSRYVRNRVRWLHARAQGLGASDAPAVFGLHPWVSPLSLFLRKANPDFSDEMSEYAFWGHALEDAVAKVAGRREELRIGHTPGLLAHPEHYWMLATVDRLVFFDPLRPNLEPAGAWGVGPLEVKTSSAYKLADWPADGTPPDHVVVQLQHQLAVGGWQQGYVAALIGGNTYRFWRIERWPDEDIATMIATEEAFWQRVINRDPPPPTGHEADAAALMELYPAVPGSELICTDEIAGLLENLTTYRQQRKDAEKREEEVRLEIKAAMGSATVLLDGWDGAPLATYREHTRVGLDQKRLRRVHAELWRTDQFGVEKKVRPLRIKDEETDGRA